MEDGYALAVGHDPVAVLPVMGVQQRSEVANAVAAQQEAKHATDGDQRGERGKVVGVGDGLAVEEELLRPLHTHQEGVALAGFLRPDVALLLNGVMAQAAARILCAMPDQAVPDGTLEEDHDCAQ
mgnify:CR=1 FL=1